MMDKILRKEYCRKTKDELAEMFGVTKSQIELRVSKLGFKKRIIKNEWSEDMKLFLIQNYKTMDRALIAEKLGVSPESVSHKAYNLGLSKC